MMPIQEIPKENFINIIVADDEIFTRQSTVRILNIVSNELGIKINIIEAEDGVETIYIVFKAATQGVKISMIISDDNMNFVNGSRCSVIMEEIIEKKRIAEIPFYLLTAYEDKEASSSIKMVLVEPSVALTYINSTLFCKRFMRCNDKVFLSVVH